MVQEGKKHWTFTPGSKGPDTANADLIQSVDKDFAVLDAQNEAGLAVLHAKEMEGRAKSAEALAGTDALTELASRRVFDTNLKHALDSAVRARTGKEHRSSVIHVVSLIIIDLDHFKQVNDRYGHQAGDTVLREVGKVLRESVRVESDTIARYGGEELAIIMPGADGPTAAKHAEEIRMKIEALTFPNHEGLEITASFGVATSDGDDTPEDLIALADNALYEAKEGGRNQVMSDKSVR